MDSFLHLQKKLVPSQSDVANSKQVPVSPEILVISHDDIQVIGELELFLDVTLACDDEGRVKAH